VVFYFVFMTNTFKFVIREKINLFYN